MSKALQNPHTATIMIVFRKSSSILKLFCLLQTRKFCQLRAAWCVLHEGPEVRLSRRVGAEARKDKER